MKRTTTKPTQFSQDRSDGWKRTSHHRNTTHVEEMSEDERKTHVSRAMREDGAFQEARRRWERRRDRARGTERKEQW